MESVQHFRVAAELDPEDVDIFLSLGNALRQGGEPAGAIEWGTIVPQYNAAVISMVSLIKLLYWSISYNNNNNNNIYSYSKKNNKTNKGNTSRTKNVFTLNIILKRILVVITVPTAWRVPLLFSIGVPVNLPVVSLRVRTAVAYATRSILQ